MEKYDKMLEYAKETHTQKLKFIVANKKIASNHNYFAFTFDLKMCHR